MKKLQIQYAIFYGLILFSFGLIVITQTVPQLLTEKVDKKINNYLKDNYSDLSNIKKNKTVYRHNRYEKKITNKDNSNYYFYIYYQDKKITDTYKKDYEEGKSFLKNISTKIENDIYKKINKKYKVNITDKLSSLSNTTKQKLIKEENLSSQNIYNLEIKLNSKINTNELVTNISYINKKLKDNNINPKSITMIITDKNKTIIINNLVINNDLKQIISDIINNKESNILKKYNITFEQN